MSDSAAEPPLWRHPQVERALVAAAELLEHGWPEDAVEPLTGALALHGDDAEVLRILAVAFWSAGDLDAARTAVRRAITTDPDDVEGYLLAAHLAEEADDVVEARSAWAAAVELVPGDGGLAAAQLVLDLRTGQVDAATYAAATRAATAHPQHAQVNLALAWLAAREGYPGTAERALVAAVAATPADPWPRWQLLRARERRGSTIAVLADAALVLAEHLTRPARSARSVVPSSVWRRWGRRSSSSVSCSPAPWGCSSARWSTTPCPPSCAARR
ncbi:tetratricopeptide repeat protein [Curtobacterium sp. 1P10AnD]|uniref:tetratricopeptide repeat protein n=1 Tax=Curtobacterium sp. 1P10AnD TaxID=3132283 RepID=UPI0039A11B44